MNRQLIHSFVRTYSFFKLLYMLLFYFLKFIREYASKVDELIKDKIEAQNEEKAKEKEEKETIAQQVLLPGNFLSQEILCFYLFVLLN